jgi:hypothetical protein
MSIGTSTSTGPRLIAPVTTGRVMAADIAPVAAATDPGTAADIVRAAAATAVDTAAATEAVEATTAAERIRGDNAQRAGFLIVAPAAYAL